MKKLLIILPLLTACDEQPKIVYVPQPQSQYQYTQTAPPVSQPPVVVQQESSNGLGNFAAGAALGALAGHVGTNMMNDKKPEIKQSSMDVNRLSNYGRQDTIKSLPPSTVSKPAMNMSKLSSHKR